MTARIALVLIAVGATAAAEPPRGQMVDLGGRRLHLHCVGSGSPTVILTAGLGESSENWRSVQPRLAPATQVCAWDRAGLGSSDPSPESQDVAHTTSDLRRLLRVAGLNGPYVLVGHSIGSFETLMFAYRRPRAVAAMVLVDPSSPFQNRRFAAVSQAFARFNEARLKERTARLRECASGSRAERTHLKGCGSPASAEAIASMTESFETSSAQLTKAKRSLGRSPLIVLTAGKRAPLPAELAGEQHKIAAEWGRMHDELAALSDRGIHRQVPDSAHYIHVEEPDVVIAAIEEAIAAARKPGRR